MKKKLTKIDDRWGRQDEPDQLGGPNYDPRPFSHFMLLALVVIGTMALAGYLLGAGT